MTAEDKDGNKVEGETISVKDADGLDGISSEDTADTDSEGIASFTFTEDNADGYSPEFSAEDDTITDTASVTAEAGDADIVDVETQPGTTTAGNTIEGPPEALVTDEYGNAVEGIDVTVSETEGYTFDEGTTTQSTDTDGIATFDDLVIETADGYDLEFSIDEGDDNVSTSDTVSSNTFTVEPADAHNVTVSDETINQGEALVIDLDNLEDEYGNTLEDGDYQVDVDTTTLDGYNDSDFSEEEVNFTGGDAEGIELLTATDTEDLSGQTTNLTVDLDEQNINETFDVTVNQVLNSFDVQQDIITLGLSDLDDDTDITIEVINAEDLAGDDFDGSVDIGINTNDLVGSIGDKSHDDVSFSSGSASNITVLTDLETEDEDLEFQRNTELTAEADGSQSNVVSSDVSSNFNVTVNYRNSWYPDTEDSYIFGKTEFNKANEYTGNGIFEKNNHNADSGFSVKAPDDFSEIKIRYASASDDLNGEYYVSVHDEGDNLESNGSTKTFDNTGSWTTYDTKTISISGNEGQYIHVAPKDENTGGINPDAIEFIKE